MSLALIFLHAPRLLVIIAHLQEYSTNLKFVLTAGSDTPTTQCTKITEDFSSFPMTLKAQPSLHPHTHTPRLLLGTRHMVKLDFIVPRNLSCRAGTAIWNPSLGQQSAQKADDPKTFTNQVSSSQRCRYEVKNKNNEKKQERKGKGCFSLCIREQTWLTPSQGSSRQVAQGSQRGNSPPPDEHIHACS